MKWRALVVLTSINLLNYIDRNIFSALMPSIKRDLGLSDSQLGLLGSGFIFAYLFISPVFGYLGDRYSRPKVMAIGVALWSAATAFSGLTVTFFGQMLTRVSVGIGESAYSTIAPSSIADFFSKQSRGRIFAVYAGAVPVGSALGYLLGGLLEPRFGWQRAFFVVGIPGLLLAVILLFLEDPVRGSQDEIKIEPSSEREPGLDSGLVSGLVSGLSSFLPSASIRIFNAYRELLSSGGLMATVLGYAAYTFVVGGMAFWMPSYIVRYFDVSLEKGNLVFGGVTVVGGFLGTFIGGWWGDRLERRQGNGYLKVSVWSMLFAIPLFILTLSMRDFTMFAVSLFVLEIAIFLCMSPLDAAVINFVRPSSRATAMALNIFLIHVLGDGISRWLMGSVSDYAGLRAAIELLPFMLALASLLWFSGIILFWQAVPWPKNSFSLPELQSHRGFQDGGKSQENTILAFVSSSLAGAKMIECDVRLSADGQAVVFHDADLRRIGGHAQTVAELSASELGRLTGAPTLREILLDKRIPQFVNIELKNGAVRDFGLEKATVEAVREANAEHRVLFSSFNPFALRRMAKLVPEIPRALLVTERREEGNRIWFRRMWLASYARPHLLHADDQMVTRRRLRAWSERGIPVAVWTVNDPARAKELFSLGVKSIISDHILTLSQTS